MSRHSSSLEEWEGRAQYETGSILLRWLRQNPSPCASSVEDQLLELAGLLQQTGLARLGNVRLSPLRAV